MHSIKYDCIEMILAILLRIPTTDVHVKDLFDMCYSYCTRCKVDYEELIQLCKHYSSGKAIRQDNLTRILTFGFYISDLYSLLMERHITYISILAVDQKILIMYRRQLIHSTEFEQLKK